MALIPHNVFPRSMFDMDQWFHPNSKHTGPNTLDMFDAFDELDHMVGRNLEWINKPEFMLPVMPRVPQKYRIVVDCHGYQPKSIKTEIVGDRLTVVGHEEVKHEGEDFQVKQFKRTYRLPVTCECDKMVSFMTRHGQLVIEFPLRETQVHSNQDLFPRIVDGANGEKSVAMSFHVPEKIDPSKVTVSVKDRDLIVKAEDVIEKPDGISRFFYYKRTTLPENTKFDELKCSYDNHQLSVAAPLDMTFRSHRSVPIEGVKQQAVEGVKKH
jgi:HSP20 family molecular chaperone IbpA